MRSNINRLILVVGFVIASVLMGSPQEPEAGKKSIAWVVAALKHDTLKHFYGTALLIELGQSRGDEHVFVTNLHVLPPESFRGGMRLSSPLWNYEFRSVEVIGVAPGYDLAVIAAKRGDESFPEQYVQGLLDHSFSERDYSDEAVDVAILGIPGSPELAHEVRPAISWMPWLRSHISNLLKGSEKPRKLAPPPIEASNVCPPPLLKTCYVLPMANWGFSGGAMLVHEPEKNSRKREMVVGMVSHFSPFSPEMYVIPWNTVKQVVNSIQRQARRGDKVVEKLDGDLAAAYSKAKTVQLKLNNSRFSNFEVSAISAKGGKPGGGSEHMGGGSEHMGGGSETMAGRTVEGIAVPGFTRNQQGSVAYLGKFEALLRDSLQPGTWKNSSGPIGELLKMSPSFRGADTFLNYRPGVLLANSTEKIEIFGVDNTPVDSPAAFLVQLSKSPNGKLMTQLPKVDPPKRLVNAETVLGVVNYSTIRKFLSPKEIRETINDININDTAFSLKEELSPLMEAHLKHPSLDLILGHGRSAPPTAIMQARIKFDAHNFGLACEDHLKRKMSLIAPGSSQFKQIGIDSYRFEGQFLIDWEQSDFSNRTLENQVVHGVISLAKDHARKSWEVKTLFVYEDQKHLKEGSKGFLAPEALNVVVMAIPLAVPLRKKD